MIIGFGNNVISSLAADITASQTTIQVMPGTGAMFANLLTYDYANSSNPLKTYAKITLTDAKETVFEVCHLTAVNNDVLTVVRGQEGTTAKGWALNDVIANFATRGSENQFVQIEQIQSGHYTSGVAGGTANALTLALPATYFVNGSTDWTLRAPVVVYPSLNNTGAATLQLTLGGKVLGTFPLYKGNKAPLVANDILKDVALICLMDKSKTFFNVANPGAIYAGLGTAAFKDIVISMTDVTAGRIPVVGWQGIGGDAITNQNLGAINPTGVIAGTTGSPVATVTYPGINIRHASSYQFTLVGRSKRYFAQTWENGAAQGWDEFYTTANKPTASDVGALPTAGGTMTGPIASTATGAVIDLKTDITKASQFLQLTDSISGARIGWIGRGSYSTGNTKKITIYADAAGIEVSLGEDGKVLLGKAGSLVSIDSTGAVTPANYANFDARYQKVNTASKAANGWFKDTNTGIIKQWGVVNVTDNTVVTANFPIAFPSNCASLSLTVISQNGNSADQVMSAYGKIISTSQMKVSACANWEVHGISGVYFEATGY